jgi:signal transduction histidine kinase
VDRAIAIFTKHRDLLYLGLSYRQKARQHETKIDFAASRKNYHTAIALLFSAGDARELQRAYHELGRSYYQTQELDSASVYLVLSLNQAEQLKDSVKIFNSSSTLGEVSIVAGNLDNARKYLEYALSIRTPSTSKVEIRNRLASYASCLLLLGEFEKARVAIKEYELINNRFQDDWGAIILKKLNGVYEYYKGDYQKAVQYFSEAYLKAKTTKSFAAFRYDMKNITFYLAKAEYETGHYDSTILHASSVIRIATDLRSPVDLMESNLLISRAYEKKNNADSAYHYFRVYAGMKDSLLSLQKEKAIIELTTKYQTEKKEQQIKLLKNETDLYSFHLQLKNEQIEKHGLLNAKRSQELALLSQQNEINRLEAMKQTLALENQQKEIGKKQNELTLLSTQNKLQAAIVAKEGQRKKFAYITIAAILVFSSYVYYRARQNKKLSKKLAASLADLSQAQEQLIKAEKEKEAENVRVRISRDIHDEVGATLSGVVLFSEIARQKMEQRREADAQVYLEHITANSKEMVEKMSDIVWAINPENDSFERIIVKLQSYLVNICAGKDIRLHLDIDNSIRNYYPGMQVRKNIYLLIKEAVNNAVKYSGGKNIFFSLRENDGHITAEVRDDGQGFDRDAVTEGNGLINMQARAEELKASLTIDSERGKGTSIKLQFDFHPAGGQLEVV